MGRCHDFSLRVLNPHFLLTYLSVTADWIFIRHNKVEFWSRNAREKQNSIKKKFQGTYWFELDYSTTL